MPFIIHKDGTLVGEIDAQKIKNVKIISSGRVKCTEFYSVKRIEAEDDGSFSVIVED